MSLLRSAQRFKQLLQSSHHINGVRLSHRSILRHLSTAGPEQPPHEHSPPPHEQSPQIPTPSGLVYAKVLGINKHTSRTDIINLLEGSNLTLDNVKVTYDRFFSPVSMLLQFASMHDFASSIRAVTRRGKLFRIEKTGEREWNITKPYNGKYVLIQGLPYTTNPEDVHRFLEGYNYNSSTFDMFLRSMNKDLVKMASVGFHTQIEAMTASIRKNGRFLHNNQVIVRVLQ